MNERGPVTSDRRRSAFVIIALLLGAHGTFAQDAKSPRSAPTPPVVNKPVNFDAFSEVMSNLGMYWLLINQYPD